MDNSRAWWIILRHLTPQDQAFLTVTLYQMGALDNYHLWDILSHHGGPLSHKTATRIYLLLNFRPHQGFPLQRIQT